MKNKIYTHSVKSLLKPLAAIVIISNSINMTAEASANPGHLSSSVNLKSVKQQSIKGTVTDRKGESLPGVSIRIKDNQGGSVTDINGEFSITAAQGDVIIISYLGFNTQEVIINDREEYAIVLIESADFLSEVVVTALGIKKEKAKLGYAVQEVKGESLQKAKEPNFINSLTGRVAGLRINTSTELFQDAGISLRGRKPLIVIDGIPDQSADMWKVNADDVESISVLKGASASALYGSIGQNGAIMITTKRGTENKTSIDVNSSTMFQSDFIRIPEVQTTYGNGNKGRYAYVDGSGGGTEGAGWIWGPKLDQVDPSTQSGFYETTQYDSPQDAQTGVLQPLPFVSRGRDNVKNFFETGLISTNNVSIGKGTENGSFRASVAHIYQKGIVPNTDLKNTSFSLSGNYGLTDKLSVDGRVTYNREYTNNFPETGYGPTNYLYNLVLWTGPDVDIRGLRNYWKPGQEGVQQMNYNTSWYNNPYFQAFEYMRGYHKDNTFGSFDVNYKFSPSLSAKFRTGVNIYGLNRSYNEPKSYIGYSNISKGNYVTSTQNYGDIVSDLLLSYQRDFGKNFSLRAEAGGSNYYRNHKYQSTGTDGLTIPNFYNLANSINPVQGTNGVEERRTTSFYGFADLEFFHAFYLTIAGRNDKISTLPIANNSYFYPSVTGSVLISELVNFPNWLSYLKARGSWSRVSSGTINDNAYTYGYLQTYDKGTNWNGVPALSYGNTLINPDIKPQTSDSWEAGVELKLFNNRIGFDATYFQTRDYNNIVSIPVSVTSAYSSKLDNGNVYQRKGIELVVTATPVRSTNFRWDVAGNFSTYRRYLQEIYGEAKTLNNLKVGDRTDKIHDWVYETDPKGNIVYQANGFPQWETSVSDRGYNDPDWTYGIENTFAYKNLSLKFLMDGRLGGLIYSTTNQKMWWGGTNPGTVNQYRDDANLGNATYVGEGVVITSGSIEYDSEGNLIADTRTFAPNTKAVNYIDYMIETSNNAHTNYNYYSETFLKLREVTLSMQLPNRWLQKGLIREASISAVGRNLLLFSKLPNVDPDSGADDLQTPSTRNIGFNLNFKF